MHSTVLSTCTTVYHTHTCTHKVHVHILYVQADICMLFLQSHWTFAVCLHVFCVADRHTLPNADLVGTGVSFLLPCS